MEKMKNIYDILIEKRRINYDKTVYVGRKEFKISDFVRVFGTLTPDTSRFKITNSLFKVDKIEIKNENDASLVRQMVHYFDNNSKRLITVSGDVNISNCDYLSLFLFHEGKETIKNGNNIIMSNFSKKGTAKIFVESCSGIKIESNNSKGKDIYVDYSGEVFVNGSFNSLNVNKSRVYIDDKVYIDNDKIKTNIKNINATNYSSVSYTKTAKIGKVFLDHTSEMIDSTDATLRKKYE